jgi:DHA2 family multidrug resistance protein
VRSIVPIEALTIGCLLQRSRLVHGEIGTAFMQTFVRTREQFHSNVIGRHIAEETALTAERRGA